METAEQMPCGGVYEQISCFCAGFLECDLFFEPFKNFIDVAECVLIRLKVLSGAGVRESVKVKSMEMSVPKEPVQFIRQF